MVGVRIPNPIADFRAKVQECTHEAVCGRSYVLVGKLTKWLNEPSQDPSFSRAASLLYYTYRDDGEVALKFPPEKVCDDRTCSLLVFSILLEIGHGCLIDRFQRRRIFDTQLPIDLQKLRTFFEELELHNAIALAKEFDSRQWAFCPVKFDLHQGQDCGKNKIIPICGKEEINTGGTAKVYMITVQEEFVEQLLRDIVADSRFNDTNDLFGYRYEFALKVFEEGNGGLYENEVKAFRALEEHDGMVRYLTDYVHTEVQNKADTMAMNGPEGGLGTITTYNILLEYGELDLDQFFGERLPPVLHHEVQEFWKNMFEVADAVKRIHDFEKSRGGERQEYCGWHADIKPANILSVRGKLKLADPGFARFVKKTDRDKDATFPGGTRTYGPPECFHGRGSLVHIPRAIDIWSLGCVFSIAATWVVLGFQGILQFNKMRKKAIEKIVQRQSSESTSGERSIGITRGDYFHGGKDVLDDIKHWHDVLRSAMRRTDTITGQVLDLVDQVMLKGNARDRIKAKDLCSRLNEISSQSQLERRVPLSGNISIVEALLQVDEDFVSEPMGSKSGMSFATSRNRVARKRRLYNIPSMKTSHRSEILKSELAIRSGRPVAPTVIYENYIEGEFPSTQCPPLDAPDIEEGINGPPMTPNFDSNPAGNQRPRPARLTHPSIGPSATHLTPRTAQKGSTESIKPQNVFQARADIERRTNRLLRRTPRDELLSRHFKNRDIKFLVDNAWSMEDFWDEATNLLETLVLKAKGQDEDGMDLTFTLGQVKIQNKNDPSKFKKAMEDPKAKPMFGNRTDINESLGDILSDYLLVLKRRTYERAKKLTLIVFTDGKWEGIANKHDVDDKIVDFLEKLGKAIGNLQVRPVSIQFVQFGNDADAKIRLRRLDNELIYCGVPDTVDTEHSLGDVNKMLLGSFVEEYDQRGEDPVITPPASPQSRIDVYETRSPRMTTDKFQRFFSSEEAMRTSPPPMHALPYSLPGTNRVQRSSSTNGLPPSPAEPLRSASLTYSHHRDRGGKDVKYSRA